MAKDSSYFTGDRDFWDDGDFDSMKEQCVYAMIWQAHGTDIAGIRQRNDRLDAVRVHLTIEEFQDTLSILYAKGKISLYPNKIWVKPGIWRNLGKGNYSKQQMEAVVTRLKHCNTEGLARDVVEYYKEKYGMEIPYIYPIDTLPLCTVPIPVTETELKNTTPEYSDVVRELSELLLELILKNKPDRIISQSWMKNTLKSIDLLIRKDNRKPDQIQEVIEWCQSDTEPRGSGNFCWAPNIWSGLKLRKHFDKLEGDMERSKQSKEDSSRGW